MPYVFIFLHECNVLKKYLIHIYSWHKFESQSAGACVSVLECHCVSVSGTLIRPSCVKPSLRSSWEINLSRFLCGQPLYASLPPTASPNVYRTIASLHPTQRTHTHWAKSNAYQPHTCIFIQFLCIFGTPADKWITKSGRKDESTQGGGECVCVSWWESEKETKRERWILATWPGAH